MSNDGFDWDDALRKLVNGEEIDPTEEPPDIRVVVLGETHAGRARLVYEPDEGIYLAMEFTETTGEGMEIYKMLTLQQLAALGQGVDEIIRRYAAEQFRKRLEGGEGEEI